MFFSVYILNQLSYVSKTFKHRNAFYINENFYTYNEFFECISKIRIKLKSHNPKNKNIGLIVNDDIETYASIWAIWLEGMAYIPIHPLQPIERSHEIIQQADIDCIIDSDADSSFKNLNLIVSSKLIFETLYLEPIETDENDLAYILFTSGSTGKPKGVQITRKNLGAFMKSFWETGFRITENDRCLQCFDLTFDVSVQSFLVPLTKGACTYTIPHNQIKYSYVYGLLEDHEITFAAMAPSMIRYLRPYFEEINAPALRYNILTAEASPLSLVEEWSKCIPNAEIYDFYGPTEATIYCTSNKFQRAGINKQLNGLLSIGKIMPGLKGIIVDENLKHLGTNEKGELCISGPQVTPGYWNNPKKNSESFFETEIDGHNCIFYKTGDSCYFDEDGDIMLAGRLDHQVKIQGFRIELGEIEYHTREFLNGPNAVACTFTNEIQNTEIAIFVEGKSFEKKNLLEYLNNKLPKYMVPTKYILLDDFPINTSGKVDRISLKNLLK